MKVLITGASGFVGRECRQHLREQGHDIVTTDRSGDVDFALDLSRSQDVQRLPPADAVVHCAAVQYVSKDLPWVARQAYFTLNNVVATRNLCEHYTRSPETYFVNVGTSMMYRQCGAQRYDETSPMDGQGVYSESKLAAQAFVSRLPNPHATLIPCIIGGAGREGLFGGFVRAMMRRGMVAFPGSGEHKTHMVHVSDVAALIGTLLKQRAQGFFNAAAPRPLSINEWVAEIASELGLRAVRTVRLPLPLVGAVAQISRYRLIAREQLLMLSQSHVLGTAASTALGWQPRFDNARIVRDTARAIAQQEPRG